MPFPVGAVLATVAGHTISALIFKVIGSFGFGFIVWKGLDLLFDGAKAEIVNLSSDLAPELLNMFFLLRLDDAVSVIFGAIAIRISFKTMGVGANRGISMMRAGASAD